MSSIYVSMPPYGSLGQLNGVTCYTVQLIPKVNWDFNQGDSQVVSETHRDSRVMHKYPGCQRVNG